MKLCELARSFGMTVEQLAEHAGYTRQAFYQGLKNTTKAKAAIIKLHHLNSHFCRIELEEAQRRYEVRAKALKELEQCIQKGGEMR